MEILKKIILVAMLLVLCAFIGIFTFENGLLLSIISIGFIILFVKKAKIKKFSLFLILFSLVTKTLAIFILKVPMGVDYETMYNASLDAISGNFDFIKSNYFSVLGYQLGNVFYQAIALKFINSVLFLKFLNCIYATVITWLIYKIVQKFAKEDTARITSLIYSISLYPIYLNSVLGNQQLSLMLFLIGIYILLTRKSTLINTILIGILFALGNLERPEGIIYIVTLIIYNIVTLKNIKLILKSILPVLITYITLTQLFSFILIKTTENEIGFKNSDSYWKFVLGFNYEYNGKNNIPDYEYFNNSELEKEVIIDRISQVNKLPNLFYQKSKILWLYDDLDLSFNATNSTQFNQHFIELLSNYIRTINMVVLVLAFIAIFRNKNIDNINYFFMINALIYFAVYLLIEVSARYYYNPQICIIILSSLGIERIIDFVKQKNLIKK